MENNTIQMLIELEQKLKKPKSPVLEAFKYFYKTVYMIKDDILHQVRNTELNKKYSRVPYIKLQQALNTAMHKLDNTDKEKIIQLMLQLDIIEPKSYTGYEYIKNSNNTFQDIRIVRINKRLTEVIIAEGDKYQ